LGARGEVAQRGRPVGAPGLGDEADVQAELLGLEHEGQGVGPAAPVGRLDGGGRPHQALAELVACALSTRSLIAARVPAMLVSNSRIRTKTIFCSLSGIRSMAWLSPERAGPICIHWRRVVPLSF